MTNNPFSDIPPAPVEHFKLLFYAAVLRVIEQASSAFESRDEMLKRFPFLIGYYNVLAERGLNGCSNDEVGGLWQGWLQEWEAAFPGHLPLRALKETARLDYAAMTLLLCIGLVEEEPCFGALFEAMHGITGQHRPVMALLNGWWPEAPDHNDARALTRRFQELGFVKVLNPDAPQSERVFQAPGALWDVMRGGTCERPAPGLQYLPAEKLPEAETLILPETTRSVLFTVSSMLSSGKARALVVRGPRRNGRKTLLGAVARRLGRGLLIVRGLQKADDERWGQVGPLATALCAMPVIVTEPGPGDTADIPALNGYDGPVGVVLGKQGGISGPSVEDAVTIALDMPGIEARRLHWAAGFGPHPVGDADTICERFRMTPGNIRRSARLAVSYAAMEGRNAVMPGDVRQANRALNRQVLDVLAARLECSGDWGRLAGSNTTMSELRTLESRCRYREQLQENFGSIQGISPNAGVRALFSGPSGTGKTLAAKLLASSLLLDIYRVDLSSVVNKYIGETEKNLNTIFSRAEELDVILLLDEGDALLTQRTNVQSSNDRYANLETNFLLQRIESFEGILLVTTNAGSRIDSAFQRRMDVVVEFRQPEPSERWDIWQMHLPPVHKVDAGLLGEIAGVCTLNGGQIRNTVLHASLLALNNGKIITSAQLVEALQREYRKAGAICPLREGSLINGSTR